MGDFWVQVILDSNTDSATTGEAWAELVTAPQDTEFDKRRIHLARQEESLRNWGEILEPVPSPPGVI